MRLLCGLKKLQQGSAVGLEKRERLERLELVQKDTGEIVLQAHDGAEPLMQLRFNARLTDMLGAEALTLAQAMVESASDAFEFAMEPGKIQPTTNQSANPYQNQQPVGPIKKTAAVDIEDQADSLIRLRTTPLH